jgi:hypothetical protein
LDPRLQHTPADNIVGLGDMRAYRLPRKSLIHSERWALYPEVRSLRARTSITSLPPSHISTVQVEGCQFLVRPHIVRRLSSRMRNIGFRAEHDRAALSKTRDLRPKSWTHTMLWLSQISLMEWI